MNKISYLLYKSVYHPPVEVAFELISLYGIFIVTKYGVEDWQYEAS